MDEHLADRMELLLQRLRTSYDGIGHSSGRPYVYFVYSPSSEREIVRMAEEQLRSDNQICFHHIDLLTIALNSIEGQEQRRQELLGDPLKSSGMTEAVVRLWAKGLNKEINERLNSPASKGRPVVVLRGMAALHPLGNPTSMMEALAEQEPRDPTTNAIIPIVLLVPGIRPPQTSRRYLFLGQEKLRLDFYRGEEI